MSTTSERGGRWWNRASTQLGVVGAFVTLLITLGGPLAHTYIRLEHLEWLTAEHSKQLQQDGKPAEFVTRRELDELKKVMSDTAAEMRGLREALATTNEKLAALGTHSGR